MALEIPALQVKSQFLSVERDNRQSPMDKGHPRAQSRDDGGLPQPLWGEKNTEGREIVCLEQPVPAPGGLQNPQDKVM